MTTCSPCALRYGRCGQSSGKGTEGTLCSDWRNACSYNVENDLWQMELHYNKEEDLREEIFYYMAEHRLPIYEMKMTSKSLEDVFLELTKEQEKSAAAEEMTGRTAKERAAEENSQTAETTQKEETDNAGNMEKGI